MFGRVIAKLPPNNGVLKLVCPSVTAVRHGHHIHGKPIGVAKNIQERLECKLSFASVLRLGFPYRKAEITELNENKNAFKESFKLNLID